MPRTVTKPVEQPVDVRSVFLDSGAHSLFMAKVHRGEGKRRGYKFYDTDEFWEYVDRYAQYVKRNEDNLDCYVNVDVIHDPQRSWDVLKYLEEEYGLHPLPVLHYGLDEKWIKRHMDEYEYLGVGGMSVYISKAASAQWMDRVFALLCDDNGFPQWKTHGFAVNSVPMIWRYPWYSVDATTPILNSGWGVLLVPGIARRGSAFALDYKKIWRIRVSVQSPYDVSEGMRHVNTLPPRRYDMLIEFIESQGYTLGESELVVVDEDYELQEGEFKALADEALAKQGKKRIERVVEPGLANNRVLRNNFNIDFFNALEDAIPSYPRKWEAYSKVKRRAGFGLT